MQITNRKNLPAALVRACEMDPYDPGTADISITRLLAPPRQVALMKLHAEELTEDVADRIWALRSQGIHAVLERATEEIEAERHAVIVAMRALRQLAKIQGLGSVDEEHSLASQINGLQCDLDELERELRGPQPSEIAEERWERMCLGWRVSGKLDLVSLREKTLTDWKDTSVWSIKDALTASREDPSVNALTDNPARRGKPEWEQQTNLLAYFGKLYGYDIQKVQVVAFGRDWRKNEKLRFDDYPDDEVTVIPLRLWSEQEAQAFLEARVALHQQAQFSPYLSDPAKAALLPCTPEERWEKPTTYAVCKKGNKTATRLYEDADLAAKHAASQPGLEVRVRPGASPRCEQYCSALPFCDQGQAIVAAKASA